MWPVWCFLRSSSCKRWDVQEEHELTTFLRNVRKRQPSDRVTHRRRPESNNTYYSFGGCNRDPIRPGNMGSKELCPGVPQNSIRDARYPAFFQVIITLRFWQWVKPFWFSWWEKISTAHDSYPAASDRTEQARDRKVCRRGGIRRGGITHGYRKETTELLEQANVHTVSARALG
jgi:hypothetical protein